VEFFGQVVLWEGVLSRFNKGMMCGLRGKQRRSFGHGGENIKMGVQRSGRLLSKRERWVPRRHKGNRGSQKIKKQPEEHLVRKISPNGGKPP